MPGTSPTLLSWPPVSGTTGYFIEYKLQGDTDWITAPGANPTLTPAYELDLPGGEIYDVRITNYGATCNPKITTFTITPPISACCPPTFTLSDDGTYCFKETITSPIAPTAPENTISKTNLNYSANGSVIYDPGFNINGTGPFTQIPYSNPFWVNGAGFPSLAGVDLVKGPLNRSGLWSSTLSSTYPQEVGYSVCIDVPEDGYYYVGVGADNYATISVDGVTVLNMSAGAMSTYMSAHGYAGTTTIVTFRFWHIYPIFLTAGVRTITAKGVNEDGPAGFGMEIYDATSSEIGGFTSYASMGAQLLFSSKDYIGQPVQIGNQGVGYTCAIGDLQTCNGLPYTCYKRETAAIIDC